MYDIIDKSTYKINDNKNIDFAFLVCDDLENLPDAETLDKNNIGCAIAIDVNFTPILFYGGEWND